MYQPRYAITNKILKNIGIIEAAKEVVENAPLVPSYEKRFQSDAIIRTIHHGTHIEGNDMTLIQTKKILEGEHVYGRARDIQEIINYRNVMTLLDELAVKRGEYEIEMLKDLHRETTRKIIPEETIGVLRETQVVVKEEGTGQVIFEPPPFIEINYLLEDFFAWLNSFESREVHPVIKAGIAHYILVAIHPFVEGNGRVSRAFANLILLRENFGINRFFSFEEHFDSDPGAYYQAFAQVDRQSKSIGGRDLTPWLEYFTEVVALELTKIKERVRKISIDNRLKLKVGEQVELSERQMRLMEYISDRESANMQELKTVLPMISEDTILRDVREMLERQIIKKVGSTKASRYMVAK